MYSRILLLVSLEEGHDLSSMLAATQRLAMADTQVTMLHVMEKIPSYASSYLPFGYQDETRSQIEDALSDIGGNLENVEGVVLHGAPSKVVPDYVHSKGIDCVVVCLPQAGAKTMKTIDMIGQLLRALPCAVHILR